MSSKDTGFWIEVFTTIFLSLLNILIRIYLFPYALFYPYEHDYAEGVNAFSSLLLLQGKIPYIDFLYPQPFIFPYFESFLLLLFGKSFFVLRILSILIHFSTALIVYFILNMFSKDRFLSLIGTLFYLSTLNSIVWSIIAIPDHLEIFLETLSIYFFLKYCEDRKNTYLSFSSLFLFLAFFTKFFAVIALIVLSISLLLMDRSFLDKLLYFYIVIGLVPIVYIFADYITEGNFFSNTIFLHLLKPKHFYLGYFSYLFNNSILISLVFVLLIIGVRFTFKDIRIKILTIYFVFLFLFIIYGRASEGAYEHYFLHVEPVIFILIFILISKINNIMLKNMVVLLLVMQVIFSSSILSHYINGIRCTLHFSSKMDEIISKYDIDSGTKVIIEIPGIAFYNNLIISGNFIDCFCYNLLYKSGYWSDKKLIRIVMESDVKLIIIGSRLSSFENFTKYVSQHYILKERVYYCDFTGERQVLYIYFKP